MACGPSREVARALGIQPQTLRQYVARYNRGTLRQYSILAEHLSREEWDEMYKEAVTCPLSGLITDQEECASLHEACRGCGWNSLLNMLRRKELRRLAAEGKLGDWGKDK